MNTGRPLRLMCVIALHRLFQSLKDQICEHMAPSITADTCCSIFSAADTFGCLELREQALTKLFNTFASAIKSQGFLEFTHDQVISVLGSDRVLDCDESVVFEAAVRWLQHSDDRYPFTESILSVVRFPAMDPGYLSDVIKVHPIMTGVVPSRLLMEAFEHHALRASGREGLSISRTQPRKRSCSFNSATLLDGHQDAISALLVFGDKLISGSWDSAVKVWSTDTWTCERTLSDHTGTIRSLTACEGKVVSASDDGNIKVWNPDGWSLVRTLEGHTESVNCVIECLGRLASASDDGTIKLWNTDSWTCEVTIHHGPPVNSDAEDDEDGQSHSRSACGVMSIVCCGDKLVSASDDAQIKVWNTHSWVCEHVLRADDDEIWAMMVTEDGWLVSGERSVPVQDVAGLYISTRCGVNPLGVVQAQLMAQCWCGTQALGPVNVHFQTMPYVVASCSPSLLRLAPKHFLIFDTARAAVSGARLCHDVNGWKGCVSR